MFNPSHAGDTAALTVTADQYGSPSTDVGRLQAAPPTQMAPVFEEHTTSDIQSSLYVWAESLQKIHERSFQNVREMEEWIEEVRNRLRTLGLGEISVSPYDTAWVARVPALDGSIAPQFPLSLQWIIDHQLPDGDWEDSGVFLAFDRVINTLACIVALQTWSAGADNVARGVGFLRSNLQKMEEDDAAHMPIGFEILFPSMLDDAKALALDLPYNAPIVQRIAAEKKKTMEKMPMETLHKYPTILLHSVEGLREDVDWNKLLKFQLEDGSFLTSPACTACALMYTKDLKCLDYLTKLLTKFDNACPAAYPQDLFEHLFVVDRLERLGISRYFEQEIRACLEYVSKHWTGNGIAWASNSNVQEVDDTAMGFRLLRSHGFHVSEDCFRQFYEDGEFFGFAGQVGQSVTSMFNLHRASQLQFPGETLLRRAKSFTGAFLKDKLQRNECFDKWVMPKDLAGEVEYALEFPWYASLPRLEHRSYLDLYGTDEIWIGKTLYRMPTINKVFLKLAKADFNLCQALHKEELQQVIQWNESCKFGDLKFARQKVVECFFLGAVFMFEPEMVQARLAWARSFVVLIVLDDYFDEGGSLGELQVFMEAVRRWDPKLVNGLPDQAKILFSGLYNTVNAIAEEAFIAQKRDVSHHLRHYWERVLTAALTEAEWTKSGYVPTMDEYMDVSQISFGALSLINSTLFFAGKKLDDEVLNSRENHDIMELTSRVGRILNDVKGMKRESMKGKKSCVHIYMHEHPELSQAEAITHMQDYAKNSMQQLTCRVFQSTALPMFSKKIYLNSAKLCHVLYKDIDGFSSLTALSSFVKKVLFEQVPE